MSDRILLVGGTFDPPHRAHVVLAGLAAESLGCGRILFIPAARNPLKGAPGAGEKDRVRMLELALRDLPTAEICTLELDRGGASYFVETLEELRARLGERVALRFVIGADHALAFRAWKDWPRILDLAAPAVLLRPPWTKVSLERALADEWGVEEAARWADWIVETPLMDVSASRVRRSLARGEPLDDLLDPAVAEYVLERGLYRE